MELCYLFSILSANINVISIHLSQLASVLFHLCSCYEKYNNSDLKLLSYLLLCPVHPNRHKLYSFSFCSYTLFCTSCFSAIKKADTKRKLWLVFLWIFGFFYIISEQNSQTKHGSLGF